MDNGTKSVGKIIFDRRTALSLTQKDVADYVGVSEATVSRWESGHIDNMRRDRIAKLAKILRISPLVIMGVDEPASSAPPTPQKSDGLPELNARDERDIQKRLKSMLDDLDPNAGLAYYNGEEPMDDETRDLIRAALENSLRVAKQIAKAKYTPKKYRNE